MEINRAKDQSPPILVLGLPRTGTSSTRAAFQHLGYQHIYHMVTVLFEHQETAPAWDNLMLRKYKEKKPIDLAALQSLIQGYEVLSDYPAAAFPAELISLYPDAKVILTKRDAEGWVKSIDSTVMLGVKSPALPNLVALLNPTWRRIWSMFQTLATVVFPRDFIPNGVKFYENHNAEVRRLMASAPDQFLEFDVREGWGPLCAFLGTPVPQVPFPRVNDTDTFKRLFKGMLFGHLMQGLKRYVIAGACVGLVLVAWKKGGGWLPF